MCHWGSELAGVVNTKRRWWSKASSAKLACLEAHLGRKDLLCDFGDITEGPLVLFTGGCSYANLPLSRGREAVQGEAKLARARVLHAFRRWPGAVALICVIANAWSTSRRMSGHAEVGRHDIVSVAPASCVRHDVSMLASIRPPACSLHSCLPFGRWRRGPPAHSSRCTTAPHCAPSLGGAPGDSSFSSRLFSVRLSFVSRLLCIAAG